MPSIYGPGCSTYDQDLPGATPGNVRSAGYFAAAIAGLIGVFIIDKWVHLPTTVSTSMPVRVLGAPKRVTRSVATRSLPGFSSVGHATVVGIYIAVNLILLFTMLQWPLPLLSDFGRRLGWLAVANIAFLFFLALKNTPLSFLTKYSYERLNELHQIAGYTTILLSVLHTVIFVVARSQENTLCNILDVPQHPAMAALASMTIILISALFLKSKSYEIFYILHVLFAIVVLVGVGLHRSDLGTLSVYAIIFSAAIFLADVLIRNIRFLVYRRQQTATITPLPNGGTSIILSRPVARARPGQHVRLSIHSVKALQTHPFTMVSVDPVKFVVDSHNGFTGKLNLMAREQPGLSLRATCDGPYGHLPAFEKFDRMVLIAGGSGASFTFAVAVDIVRRISIGVDKSPAVEFVWVVRREEALQWFEEELKILKSCSFVNLSIHATSATSAPALEKVPHSDPASDNLDIEMSSMRKTPVHAVLVGRPNIVGVIEGVVRRSGKNERIIVGACGPTSLMVATRNATAEIMRVSGPEVELHMESFEW